MNFNFFTPQRSRRPVKQNLGIPAFSSASVSSGASSQIFFVFSAFIHIAALIALSSSWALARPHSNVPIVAPQPAPQRPTVARMAIDIAPVRFGEMKIEKLISPPAPQSSR